MCGIAGIFDPRCSDPQSLEAQVRRMSDAIAYRGPDGDGYMSDADAGIALGHRRLAIIDLSIHGRQPMSSSDGRFTISYNGEIYNFREIRKELACLGHTFRGDSDTEVFLEACSQWGVEKALSKVAGMFAFALWDRREKRVHLVRDRLGIKPLYWAQIGSATYWASELCAIEAVAHDSLHVDRLAVAGVFRFGYVPAPLGIWRETKKLQPGTILSVDSSGNSKMETYWQFGTSVSEGARHPISDEQEALETLDAELRHVISEHMISDVPLGSFLSGGIDSSVVTAIMQAVSPRPVKTFSIGFESAQFNEAPHAHAIARHLGTDHTELYVSERHALDVVPRLGKMFDEPFADSSQIPTFLVSEMARRYTTVALTGDGGDEVFAGYSRYKRYATLATKLSRFGAAGRAVPALVYPFEAAAAALGTDYFAWRLQRLRHYMRNSDPALQYRNMISTVLDGYWARPAEMEAALVQFWPDSHALFSSRELTAELMQYLDSLTYLPDDILTKVDRASMAVSLETRVPFLDHRIVELGWRIPPLMKHDGAVGKLILRRVLQRYVPVELFDRPKMGFGVPLHEWLKGPLREWAESIMRSEYFELLGITRESVIRRYWDHVQNGNPAFVSICWIMLSLCAWCESHTRR